MELPLYDKLLNKIYAYYQTIWKDKWKADIDQEWLNNFTDGDEIKAEKERINMLYLLSKFMYFGNEELRQLLLSMYRDLFKYPIIDGIRKTHSDTLDITIINSLFREELLKTRFLGVGNPSESGVHMLYYFRQECKLSKEYFINASEIFSTSITREETPDGDTRSYLKSDLRDKSIKRFIFMDDFCGSGAQATEYLKEIVENIKFEDKEIEVNYLVLFGTASGIDQIRMLNIFNRVESVFLMDETFKVFSNESRYYKNAPKELIDKQFSKETAVKYCTPLFDSPLGFGNCELLLSLYHNTPDNTLPIFWSEENRWKPIFKRYIKIY